MNNNLLVIDFDYFFNNPVLNTESHPDVFLYDWASNETHDGTNTLGAFIWEVRAGAFLAEGKPLPKASGYEHFWDRFTLTTDARIYVADSNVHSGNMFPNTHDIWDRIDLYDAHHDAGYLDNDEAMHCGNWMLHHHHRGTRDLNVHYPPWRTSIDGTETPPVAPVNRTIDDGHTPDPTTYTMVFVCRSGAWVPSWCDNQFNDFINEAPRPVHYFGPRPTTRPFHTDTVSTHAKAQQEFQQRITALQRIADEHANTQ